MISVDCVEFFVRFSSVTPEFKAKEVVRPASIIVTTLSSPMFLQVSKFQSSLSAISPVISIRQPSTNTACAHLLKLRIVDLL